jgi:predicted small lipoprotein YifL
MNVRLSMTLVILSASLALTACGRKGNLDTPYQAAIDAREEAERNNEPLPPAPKEPVKDRKFFLDPLI